MNTQPEISEIYIHAINPGFTMDGQSNVGELIEIRRTNPDDLTPISLAGIILTYTNSGGSSIDLVEFPSNAWMTGETILLRLASSPGSELADLAYSKSIAMKAGPLVLRRGEETLDSVCWTGKDGCADYFKSNTPTTLIHNFTKSPPGESSEETSENVEEYIHLENYEPIFNKESPNLTYEKLEENPSETEEKEDSSAYETSESPVEFSCARLIFSEVLSYYESTQSEQFIEFYNPTSEQILLSNCQLRYKNKTYPLDGIVSPDDYYVRLLPDFSLTKNPTTKNTIELIDLSGNVLSEFTYYNGQKKSTSYALIGYDEKGDAIWKNTFTPTPGSKNIYQSYKPCEEGKILNEETGNCVKPIEVKETQCKEGYYVNPETGRCKKIVLNVNEEKTCQDGYSLNPLTGRCKKIVTNDGADYALKYDTANSQGSSFVALGAIIVLVILTLMFIVFEFRREIKRISVKVFHRLFHNKKERSDN
ncbi:hypothetical protein J6T21_04010 [Candidatus Saccharibacteria bacterium]|nr:hypothetical protein [Candidatus Saccharibacteria bacterium]